MQLSVVQPRLVGSLGVHVLPFLAPLSQDLCAKWSGARKPQDIMAQDSKIEWTDATFNPWWGCTKVSDGCKFCYAQTLANRYGHSVWGRARRDAPLAKTIGANRCAGTKKPVKRASVCAFSVLQWPMSSIPKRPPTNANGCGTWCARRLISIGRFSPSGPISSPPTCLSIGKAVIPTCGWARAWKTSASWIASRPSPMCPPSFTFSRSNR